jgi:hypothetical protein
MRTPGTWKWNGQFTKLRNGAGQIVNTPRDSEDKDPERRANAAIMEAAPDLEAECERLADLLEDVFTALDAGALDSRSVHPVGKTYRTLCRDYVKQARKTITKARKP